MCQFFSAIVMKPVGESECELLHHWATDSHETLVGFFDLKRRDNGDDFTRIECVPPMKDNAPDYLDIDNYKLVVDVGGHSRAPEWWTTDIAADVERRCKNIVRGMIQSGDVDTLLDGCHLVSGNVRIIQQSRAIVLSGGTVQRVLSGGTVQRVLSGGTVQSVEFGGTVQRVLSGGTVQSVEFGGTVQSVEFGGTVQRVLSGAIINGEKK